jgi:hypothetical protein
VVSLAGPTSVLLAPDAEIDETFVKATAGRPVAVTLPLVAEDSVHVEDDVVPTASDMVPAPVTVMPVTLEAGRDSVVPFTVTATFEPDTPIVTAFVAPVGATAHGPRNATEVEPLADVLASIGADAVIVTTPAFAAVTATEHVPSAAVTHDAASRLALVGVAPKVTVVPDAGAPSFVTVAVRLAFAPASTTAGPDTATLPIAVGVGLGLGVGEGDAVGAGVSLGLGEGLGDVEGDSLRVGEADGDSLGVGDAVGVGVADALGDALVVGDALGVALGDPLDVGDGLGVGVALGDSVGVGDALGD